MGMEAVAFYVGAGSLVFLGFGHTVTHLVTVRDRSKEPAVVEQMRQTALPMGKSMFSFHEGFSLVMGFLLMAFGGLNILLAQTLTAAAVVNELTALALYDLAVSLVCCALSVRYFFFVPILFTAVASVAFAVAFFGG